MTYNICASCQFENQYEKIAEAIIEISPDICGLQEVDSVNTRTPFDFTKELADTAGKEYIYSPTNRNVLEGAYGDAMLYNYKPDSIKYFEIKLQGATRVGITESQITINNEHVLVYNTHLSYQASQFRVEEANLIMKWIDKNNLANIPRIILGDFNSYPDSSGMQAFYEAGYGIVRGEDNKPPALVDHILYRPRNKWKVLEAHKPEKYKGSDHYPVWANLKLIDPVGDDDDDDDDDYNLADSIPQTKFIALNDLILENDRIKFQDQSNYTPDHWQWVFEGGTPETSNLQNPTITYETAGTFNVFLTTSNTLGSNTKCESKMITVSKKTVFCDTEDYDAEIQYFENDIVMFNNVEWLAKTDVLGITPSSSATSNWKFINNCIVSNSSVNKVSTALFYPNPFSHLINIETPQSLLGAIKIYNGYGKLMSLHKITNTKSTLLLSDLKPGVYFIELKNGHKEMLIKH